MAKKSKKYSYILFIFSVYIQYIVLPNWLFVIIEGDTDKIQIIIFVSYNMSDNIISDLHKLNRRQLLELFLEQSRETDELENQFNELTAQFNSMKESYERLKDKLNQKDLQISELEETFEKLKAKLDHKDEKLNQKDAELVENNLKIQELENQLDEEIRTHRVRIEELRKINEGISNIMKVVNHE